MWFGSVYSEGGGGGGLKIVTWADGSPEEIAAMLEAHYAGQIDIHDYWAVGDIRSITLASIACKNPSSQIQPQTSSRFVLSHAGGKYLDDGVTECAFQVDQLDPFYYGDKETSNSTTKCFWDTSSDSFRGYLNSTYKNAIPESLRDIFKQFKNYVGSSTTSYTTDTYLAEMIDTFSLRAEVELFGTTTCSMSGEGEQCDYYKNSTNRRKMKSVVTTSSNTTYNFWLRSMDYSAGSGSLGYYQVGANVNPSNFTPSVSSSKQYRPNSLLALYPFGVI